MSHHIKHGVLYISGVVAEPTEVFFQEYARSTQGLNLLPLIYKKMSEIYLSLDVLYIVKT
jgi:hypothetical protein